MGEVYALQKSGYVMFVILSVKGFAELVLGAIWHSPELAVLAASDLIMAAIALVLSKEYGYEVDEEELDLLDDEDLEDEGDEEGSQA